MLIFLFLLLLSPTLSFDLNAVVSSTPPVSSQKSPIPLDSLLSYIHHVSGSGEAECTVHARSTEDWLPVGSICACTFDPTNDVDLSPESVTKRAIHAVQSLTKSAVSQRRLIEEQARNLHPELRKMNLEIGVNLNDMIYTVPSDFEEGES